MRPLLLVSLIAQATPARADLVAPGSRPPRTDAGHWTASCAERLREARDLSAKGDPRMGQAKINVEWVANRWFVNLMASVPLDQLDSAQALFLHVTVHENGPGDSRAENGWAPGFCSQHGELSCVKRSTSERGARISWPRAPAYHDFAGELSAWEKAVDGCLAADPPAPPANAAATVPTWVAACKAALETGLAKAAKLQPRLRRARVTVDAPGSGGKPHKVWIVQLGSPERHDWMGSPDSFELSIRGEMPPLAEEPPEWTQSHCGEHFNGKCWLRHANRRSAFMTWPTGPGYPDFTKDVPSWQKTADVCLEAAR